MAATPRYAEVTVGQQLPELVLRVRRVDLVRYAGASGDFNPIHWNQRVAQQVGLPDVIAHGMLTMALAARALTDWVSDPGRVLDYGVRFTRPVPVPDDDSGAQLRVTGVVSELLEGGCVRVELTATCGEAKVLGAARATVRLG